MNFISAAHPPGTHFPKIPDLDTAGGAGNLLLTIHPIPHYLDYRPVYDFSDFREFQNLVHRCKAGWEAQGGWHGIVVVNVGRYLIASDPVFCQMGVEDLECFLTGVRTSHTPTTTVGLAGCEYQVRSIVTWTCHDGIATVSDNALFLDTVNEQTVGHELGHALSLLHVCPELTSCAPMNLMNPIAVGGSPGSITNIGISNNDLNSARRAASYVPNVVVDPPEKVELGDIVEVSKLDAIFENSSIPSYADLSALKVIYNKSDDTVSFGQEIAGMLPDKIPKKLEYWTLVNTDNKSTGATKDLLTSIGVPPTESHGIDLVMKAEPVSVQPQVITIDKDPFVWQNVTLKTSAWGFGNGNVTELPSEGFFRTFVVSSSVLPANLFVQPGSTPVQPPAPTALYQIFYVFVPVQHLDLSTTKSFLVQAMITNSTGQNTALDSLVNSTIEKEGGARLILENTAYPIVYFPNGNTAQSPGTVNVTVEGISPESNITGSFDRQIMIQSTTQTTGKAEIAFPIPANATEGFHSLTFIQDGTAITAAGEVYVKTKVDCENLSTPEQCKK